MSLNEERLKNDSSKALEEAKKVTDRFNQVHEDTNQRAIDNVERLGYFAAATIAVTVPFLGTIVSDPKLVKVLAVKVCGIPILAILGVSMASLLVVLLLSFFIRFWNLESLRHQADKDQNYHATLLEEARTRKLSQNYKGEIKYYINKLKNDKEEYWKQYKVASQKSYKSSDRVSKGLKILLPLFIVGLTVLVFFTMLVLRIIVYSSIYGVD